MRNCLLLLATAACFTVHAAAQTTPRGLDNFDLASGVQVYLPPQPEPIRSGKKRRGTKWEVAVEDKLVKKTGQTMPVTEGLANREPLLYPATKLAMGTGNSL